MADIEQQTEIIDFNRQLHVLQNRVDQALTSYLDAQPFSDSPLVGAMRHGALLGGKRLRPYLVYATGELFGIDLENLDAPAAAIECIHAYSLIHDDLPAMDDDDLRRGQPTCHIRFGEANAILAGDALQTLAFTLLADAPMPAVRMQDRLSMISELASASGVAGMCAGQALDLAAEGQHINLQALEQIHRHKTGRSSAQLYAWVHWPQAMQAAPRCRYSTLIHRPSDWLSRYRTTFWMSLAIPKNSVNVRELTSNSAKVPTRPCWGLRAHRPKPGIYIRKPSLR